MTAGLGFWQEVFVMNRIVIAVAATLLISHVAVLAQTQTANLTTPLSPSQARDLMKSAHTGAEYTRLADYFHQRETVYRAKAADEKVEMDRRAQVNSPLYQKYPRPVDTAKALYDSYTTTADSAALQARHFDELAGNPERHEMQVAGQGHS
jgi:hypothetical protein